MNLDYIDELIDIDMCYVYYKNKPILQGMTIRSVREEIKKNIDPPEEDKTIFLISFGKSKNKEQMFFVHCGECVITPNLIMVTEKHHKGKMITYSKAELEKRKFNVSDIVKIIKAVEKETIGMSTLQSSITEVLEASKKKVSNKKTALNLDYIDDIVDINAMYVFHGHKLILKENGTMGKLKNEIKNFDPPKKDMKVFIITFGKSKNKEKMFFVHCEESTITTNLGLITSARNKGKMITYSEAELTKREFRLSDVGHIIKVMTNDLISMSTSKSSITEVLEASKKKVSNKKTALNLDYIDDIVDINAIYVFHGHKLILKENGTMGKLKKEIKKNIDPPKKDMKVFIISFGKTKRKEKMFYVGCDQSTITPKLNLVADYDDTGKMITYSEAELTKREFRLSDVGHIIKVMTNELISMSTSKSSISEVLEASKKKVSNKKTALNLDYIDDIVDMNAMYVFHGHRLILKENGTMSKLQKEIKKNIDPPKKDMKVFIINFGKSKNKEKMFFVNCSETTISPDLYLIADKYDKSKMITYSEAELTKREFRLSDVGHIIKVMTNDLIEMGTLKSSISEVLEAALKKVKR
jgi:methyl coenzyme M reductase gamma subunit